MMNLTPREISDKEFRKVLRGYCPQEVEEHLQDVQKRYEIIYKEYNDLKKEINDINDKIEHYSKLEETIQNTLLLAQNTADQVKATAKLESTALIREANDTAQKILDKAHGDVIQINDEYDKVKQEFTRFRAKFRSFMNFQLETFDELERDFIKNFNISKPEDNEEIVEGVQIQDNDVVLEDKFKAIYEEEFNDANEIKSFFVDN